MPCQQCQKPMIEIEDEYVCPYCNHYTMLDSVSALEVVKRRIYYMEKAWKDHASCVDKHALLERSVVEQEKTCMKFHQEGILDVNSLIAHALLLKKLTKTRVGNAVQGSSRNDELLVTVKMLLSFEDQRNLIQSCLGKMLYFTQRSPNTLSLESLLKDFYLCPDERYQDQASTYEGYNLYPESAVAEKKKELIPTIEELREKPPSRYIPPPNDVVDIFYGIIRGLYYVISRNEIIYSMFDFCRYKEIMDDPNMLREFAYGFPSGEEGIVMCTTAEFITRARMIFGNHSTRKLRTILLLNEKNPDPPPLFIEVQKNGSSYVLMSLEFINIIYYVLHAEITKQLLNDESSRRGTDFEYQVEQKFRDAGFIYCPRVRDRKKATLEIDGIATKGNLCFVVEVKSIGITKLMEQRQTRFNRINTLKGIVDGQRPTSDGIKKIPSLPYKIHYAKQYTSSFECPPTRFGGLIVTKLSPEITEYKGVRIFSINKLDEFLANADATVE